MGTDSWNGEIVEFSVEALLECGNQWSTSQESGEEGSALQYRTLPYLSTLNFAGSNPAFLHIYPSLLVFFSTPWSPQIFFPLDAAVLIYIPKVIELLPKLLSVLVWIWRLLVHFCNSWEQGVPLLQLRYLLQPIPSCLLMSAAVSLSLSHKDDAQRRLSLPSMHASRFDCCMMVVVTMLMELGFWEECSRQQALKSREQSAGEVQRWMA